MKKKIFSLFFVAVMILSIGMTSLAATYTYPGVGVMTYSIAKDGSSIKGTTQNDYVALSFASIFRYDSKGNATASEAVYADTDKKCKAVAKVSTSLNSSYKSFHSLLTSDKVPYGSNRSLTY